MNSTAVLLWKLLPLAASMGAVLWVFYRWLKKSDEPIELAIRLLVTLVLAGMLIVLAVRANEAAGQIFVLIVGLLCGLVFTVLWGPSLCGWVAKQFTNLYDGGDTEIEPRPLYSIAEARRKQGKYVESIAEIRNQLQRFPDDFHGMMMLGEIQAKDMNDLAGAQITIEQILQQEGHSPKNVAYALSQLAEWQLTIGQDRESALATFERIVQTLPDSEHAQLARQRIAHLTPEHMMHEKNEPRKIQVKHHDENLGLVADASTLYARTEEAPGLVASGYLKHLEKHPHDFETREKLAIIYADYFQRLDLAGDQLEQLIAVPHQPVKQVVHWLNLLADIQVRLSDDLGSVRQTLQRIVDRFPKSAAAENALTRMAYLNMEAKQKQKSQVLKLGSYEQNLGLKEGAPTEDGGQSACQSR